VSDRSRFDERLAGRRTVANHECGFGKAEPSQRDHRACPHRFVCGDGRGPCIDFGIAIGTQGIGVGVCDRNGPTSGKH
jgi:hypothetical protein